jgi:hypothetical protein
MDSCDKYNCRYKICMHKGFPMFAIVYQLIKQKNTIKCIILPSKFIYRCVHHWKDNILLFSVTPDFR